MYRQNAITQYQHANASAVLDASPHRVITLLMQGALDRMSQAKGHMANAKMEAKNTALKKASDIIDCLRSSLVHEHSPEMTQNLDNLYEYMLHQLLKANAANDPDMIDEVAQLLGTIYSAWSQVEGQSDNSGSGLAYNEQVQQTKLVK